MSIRRAGNPVSLFPFLAVLVCAMGALIFLLLVVTRQIRAEARAEAIEDARLETDVEASLPPDRIPESPQPPPEPTPAVVSEPDQPFPVLDDVAAEEVDWTRMLDLLSARRREAEGALSRARTQSGLVETRLQEIGRELARLRQDETDSASRRAELVSRVNRLRDRAEDLREEIGRRRRAIRERTAEIESAESRFAFLPFDSSTGTHRRPIFIECHPDRIEFAAERIKLRAGDLAGYTRRANPLLAGVRALVDHWSDRDANATGDADPGSDVQQPYVLMVVRPGGIHAYYLARKLLSRLETPIGYELVPQEMPLTWPVRDQLAATACREAIDQSVARRPQLGPNVARPGRGDRSGGVRPPKLSGRLPAGLDGALKGRADRAVRMGETGTSAGESQVARVIPDPRSGRSGGGSRRAGEANGTGKSQGSESEGADGAVSGSAERKAEQSNPPGAGGGGGGGGDDAPTFESLTVGPPSSRNSSATGGSGQGTGGKPRHWGIASLGATIGYERRVRVRIDPDRITVAQQPRIDIKTAGGGELSDAEIRRRVIRAVQLTARNWGTPPERFYWVPAIQFEVTPGGFLHYERLNSLFRIWRLSTTVDHVLPAAPQPSIRLMQDLFEEPLP